MPCPANTQLVTLADVGFMLIRHSNSTVELLEAWDQQLQQQDRPHWDQADFNDLLKINMFDGPRVEEEQSGHSDR